MGSENGATESLVSSRFVAACMLGVPVLGATMLAVQLGRAPPVPPPLGIQRRKKKPIRVYMDGCFDMMHYGHCNALLQARALDDELIVRVVSDNEIRANKGPAITPLHSGSILF